MENYKFTVTGGEAGGRLDLYLVNHLPRSISRTRLQKLIKGKKVLLNGASHKSNHKVEAGDVIEAEILKPRKLTIAPENISLNIIYEDDKLLVVDKPAGMVAHPAPGNYTGTLVNALVYHVSKLSTSDEGRPGIVHRLDKNTSGLLIVAKDEQAHAFISRQFSRRTTDKRYIAVVEGVVQLDNGVISEPIGRHHRDRKKMAVKFADSKEAITRYKVIDRFKDHTLLEIKPETGRTHQIRVHLAYLGHPVLGDETYGVKRKKKLISRQALHASEISFLHPTTKQPQHFTSPLPADLKEVIDKLKNES